MRHLTGWAVWLLAAMAALYLSLSAVGPTLAQVKQGKPLTGIEAARYANSSGQQARAEMFCLKLLWTNIHQPEAIDILSRAQEILRKNDEAAVWNTILLRVLEEKASPADVSKYKSGAERRLAGLNKDWEAKKAKYAEAAPGKKFDSPEKVDDLWMTQVKADINTLEGLYAWKLVGGKQNAKPDWIHNAQGAMHRSGLKYVDEVDGRKGVLFGVPLKASGPAAQKLGHPTQIKMTNPGKAPFLRAGVKGYNSPFVLKIYAGGKEIASQPVGEKTWSDLKIDLKDAAGKAEQITVELVVPEDQQFGEGAWIDYLDFFEN
jgi:hypothetical protein